jgi:hypothetical protein
LCVMEIIDCYPGFGTFDDCIALTLIVITWWIQLCWTRIGSQA